MEKAPTHESLNHPKRYKTLERHTIETLPNRETIEETLECNGVLHRKCVDRIIYSASGEIDYAEQLSREELGACTQDHT